MYSDEYIYYTICDKNKKTQHLTTKSKLFVQECKLIIIMCFTIFFFLLNNNNHILAIQISLCLKSHKPLQKLILVITNTVKYRA